MNFSLEVGTSVGPRAAVLTLPHGQVHTPAFMPVATRGTVKAIDTEDLRRLGVEMVLANAYHLRDAPAALHEFMRWERPILTDSGGYQVLSLSGLGQVAIDDGGVSFKTDRGEERLTPSGAVELQERLSPDVMMTLDQPVRYGVAEAEAEAATRRTHAWAEMSLAAWSRAGSELFGIVQGGFTEKGRSRSTRAIRALGFPGYGIGGLSVGEPAELMRQLVPVVTAELEARKPRYLMGVGSEPELLRAIASGVDLFDCAWPTRLARTGTVLVGAGRLNLLRHEFAEDASAPEPDCACPACSRHSRAHLRLLFLRGELLGHRLATIHNIHHILELMRGARAAILAGGWEAFQQARLG